MTRDDDTPHTGVPRITPSPSPESGGDLLGLQRERDALLGRIAEAESQRVREAREQASQLLALQQRASNDRDALTVLHGRQIADLRQSFESAVADLHHRFDELLGEARTEAALARERASSAESRAAQMHIEQSAMAARLEAEILRAQRLAELLAEEQDRARLHPLQMDAVRQAAARDQDRAATALGARAESAAALLVERERRKQAEDLLVQLAEELDRVQVRPVQALADRVQGLLEQLSVVGLPPYVRAQHLDLRLAAPPEDADGLLQLADEAFVRAAYGAVLGREPDPGGLAAHLRQVRQGVPRVDIVAALAKSPEAHQRGAPPAWVKEWLAAALPQQTSGPRRLFSRIAQALLRPVVTQLHRIENTLMRLEASTMARAEGVAAQVDASRAAVLTELHGKVGEVVRLQARLPAEVASATFGLLQERRADGDAAPSEDAPAPVAMHRARAILGRLRSDAR